MSAWTPHPPSEQGFYWLRRPGESLTIVYVNRVQLCFSTHGHHGCKRGSLKGEWSGPINPPPGDPNELVTCPVCEGTKNSKVTGMACTRCHSTGKITAGLAHTLLKIRADLETRMADGQFEEMLAASAEIVRNAEAIGFRRHQLPNNKAYWMKDGRRYSLTELPKP